MTGRLINITGTPQTLQDFENAISIRYAADLWSFGEIASEALIWSIWGEHGRMRYREERFTERKVMKLINENRIAVVREDRLLDVMRKWHEKAFRHSEETRSFTKALSDMILDLMLVYSPLDPGWNPGVVYQRWNEICHISGNELKRTTLADDLATQPTTAVSLPVDQPSALPNEPSKSKESFETSIATGLGTKSDLSAVSRQGNHRGSGRPMGHTQRYTGRYLEPPDQFLQDNSTSQLTTEVLFSLEDGSTGGILSNPPQRSDTTLENPVTINDIWERCFEGTGRLARFLNRRVRDPSEMFPALKPVLERVKETEERNQVCHSSIF